MRWVDDTVMPVILVGVTTRPGAGLFADAPGCATAGGDWGAATGPLPGALRTSVAAQAADMSHGKASAETSRFRG